MTPARARAGDLRWVEHAYREHYAYVHRVLGRLGVPEALVEDALQDVFVVLHRRRREFEGRSSLRTWLYGIALKVGRRYRERAGQRERREAPLSLDELATHSHSLEQVAAQRQALARLDAILSEMEPSRREVFVLHEVGGLTAAEIAAILGANVNTTYSRLRLARRDFARAMADNRANPGGPHHG